MSVSQPKHNEARQDLQNWVNSTLANIYYNNHPLQHSVAMYFPNDKSLVAQMDDFAEQVVQELLPLVAENNYRLNWPRLEAYDAIGNRVDKIVHHDSYEKAGNIIYGSGILREFAKPGNMLRSFCLLYLSGHAGEAGHNCPLACSAGIIRVLNKYPNTYKADFFLEKLINPSFRNNYTGAQFLTEVQGGSDVGNNAVIAFQDDDGNWRVKGEKWFCSNANTELILMTARFDEKIQGTSGLGLFLVPTFLDDGSHNDFQIRRLKEKIGTNSMASGEIDFHDAIAYPIDTVENGFKIVMQNVLHISRLFNTFVMLGMVHSAYFYAYEYARNRKAFGNTIINYPLVAENLAIIQSENLAIMASAFATTYLQDQYDIGKEDSVETELLLRVLANINKYISALWGVKHIHHCIDVLGGNGAIESFSPLPRLFRDSIVCENWEGTHNTLRMQTLRDILKYNVDEILITHIDNKLKQTHNELKQNLLSFNKETQHLCQQLRMAKPDLQALFIRDVLDKLSIAYLAACLLIEAEYDLKHFNSNHKLLCLQLFIQQHIDKTSSNTENYIQLIKDISKN